MGGGKRQAARSNEQNKSAIMCEVIPVMGTAFKPSVIPSAEAAARRMAKSDGNNN